MGVGVGRARTSSESPRWTAAPVETASRSTTWLRPERHSTTSGAPEGASTPTLGVRTWRRLSSDASLPLDRRVEETTAPEAMGEALATADFVTIPRRSEGRPDGYSDAYAAAFADALERRYGLGGGVRVSASGRSHVVEREAVSTGAAVHLGLSDDVRARPGARPPRRRPPPPLRLTLPRSPPCPAPMRGGADPTPPPT